MTNIGSSDISRDIYGSSITPVEFLDYLCKTNVFSFRLLFLHIMTIILQCNKLISYFKYKYKNMHKQYHLHNVRYHSQLQTLKPTGPARPSLCQVHLQLSKCKNNSFIKQLMQ